MALILHLETATRVCSVALAKDGQLLALREDLYGQSHSALINTFVEEVLQDAGMGFNQLDAVAVSQGPGSYTGLRIGVSSAKGFCFALDIPLIAVNTMQAMTATLLRTWPQHHSSDTPLIPDISATDGEPLLFCPMIDARRMEVYNALLNSRLHVERETIAEIIEPTSFDTWLEHSPILFFGDGAEKCKALLAHKPNAFFPAHFSHSSLGMIEIAHEAYKAQNFANLAYFEPFYLKDYVAAAPKVKGLYN